jgi:NADPH-dependent 2,4-dienoyl-CoA reductase/sulfur reductase-like enzyme
VDRELNHVAIVGTGLAGMRTAEGLRANGYTGHLTLIGGEDHMPYDRPPLSKQILAGAWEPERAHLRDAAALDALQATIRLGVRATGLRDTTVTTADSDVVTADAVVLATGAVPRRLAGQTEGVRCQRTMADALALRSELGEARTLLVIGAGLIGAEVAHAARRQGLEVTVVEASGTACERALGTQAGALAARNLTAAGVVLRCGVHVTGFEGSRTLLSDESSVSADVVLAGIGAVPDVAWLAGSALTIDDGIVCDARGRAVGAPGVWAVGDVAAWWDPVRGRAHRTEHWTSAADQAAVVARDMLGQDAPPLAVPYVWSDQFDLKIQVVGRPDLADDVTVLHGTGMDGGPVAGTLIGHFSGDTLVAVTGFGAARHLVRYWPLVTAGADRAMVTAQGLPGGLETTT